MRGHIERGPFLLALLAALALAGCLSGIGAGGAGAGTALAEDGAQSSGTVGNEHARVGDIWYLALPAPHNTSARPIEITRVAVDHVPAGIELLGYGAYDLDDTEGLPLLTKKNGAHTPDFEKLRNYATKPVKVAAGTESDIFYLAEVRITAPPNDTLRECRFSYRQGGTAYTQTLGCEVELKVAE